MTRAGAVATTCLPTLLLAASASIPAVLGLSSLRGRPFGSTRMLMLRGGRGMSTAGGSRGSHRLLSSQSPSYSFDSVPVQHFRGAGDNDDDCSIAYRYFSPANAETRAAGTSDDSAENGLRRPVVVVFLNGLLSDMYGTKSRSLQKRANERGAGFLCFDYRGHGSSSGNFADCTMHDWMEDARAMLDHAVSLSGQWTGRVVVVGSSLGAWMALHLALEFQDMISGVIGIGSAVDFTHRTFQKLTEEQQRVLTTRGEARNPIVNISSSYLEEPFPFSQALYESGNQYLLCHDPPGRVADNNHHFQLVCRVKFLHGSEDDVVQSAVVSNDANILRLKYHGGDISTTVLNGGDHRLSRPEDIAVLLAELDDLLLPL